MADETDDVETVDNNDDMQDNIEGDVDEVTSPSLTYLVKDGRIIQMTDEHEAMVQAIDKILRTERFVYSIYSENYGNDIPDLVNKDIDYIKVEIERMVDEALLADDRVVSTTVEVVVQTSRDSVLIVGSAETIFGNVPIRKEEKYGSTRSD
ncbi:DUF2634 domain-containing protein [Apilactobacillus xinyiensis]|uniref:DUF2634 domain-containing protein n=1 Tax=Apilactobacillus xinyiensis TaxID=2841032 RepID=UPI00200E9D21|nr:DUF2634 domain-containing protein [Apilactobacillus xinyiensis]MCL0330620.1 DUF2634 domain-containing protein [Apilactobacillus xinyiensis]